MFIENLEKACAMAGTTVTPVLKELGISTGNIGRWKRGGAVSSDILANLANRLNVTTDFLITGKYSITTDALSCVNENEERLLEMYRDLPDYQKSICYAYIQGMHDANEVSPDSGEKSAAG